jgi:exopolysaccharide biosynthesis operon protein EpsL
MSWTKPALGQEDPLTLRLDHRVSWDTNVFRQPDSVSDPQPGVSGRSDRLSTTTVGLSFAKTYSQQQFLLDLNRSALRYDKFTSLDNDVYAYRAAWQWYLGPRISGTLSADRSRSEVSFADTLGVSRISRTTTNRGLTVDAWLLGDWHLLMGASRTESSNSAVFLAQPSYSQDTTDLGLRYITPSQSSIGFTARLTQGTNTNQPVDRVNFIDSEFTIRESVLSATWIASAASTLNGRLTRWERRNPHVPERDFSGSSGELRYAWMATSALSLNFSATRSLTPYAFGLDASYRREDTFVFAPTVQASERISLRMVALRGSSDYRGAVVSTAAPLRRDKTRSLEFGITWLAHRRVTLGASLRKERRTSTDATVEFDDTVASISAGLTF